MKVGAPFNWQQPTASHPSFDASPFPKKVGVEEWYFLETILDPPEGDASARAQDCNTSKFFTLIVSRMGRLSGPTWEFPGKDMGLNSESFAVQGEAEEVMLHWL